MLKIKNKIYKIILTIKIKAEKKIIKNLKKKI